MTSKEHKRKSKFLSLILRHTPEKIGLTLNDEGWADIETLLSKAKENGMIISSEEILQITIENDKQRFKISEDGKYIRANQGHSIQVNVELEEKIPPRILYHGTAQKNVESILTNGINSAKRLHVHLSDNIETAKKVGQRHGKAIILEIKTKEMLNDGKSFYLSANGVWLCKHIEPKYIIQLD